MDRTVWLALNVTVTSGVISTFTFSVTVTALYVIGEVSARTVPFAMIATALYVAFRGMGRIMYGSEVVVSVSVLSLFDAFRHAVNGRALVLLVLQTVLLARDVLTI